MPKGGMQISFFWQQCHDNMTRYTVSLAFFYSQSQTHLTFACQQIFRTKPFAAGLRKQLVELRYIGVRAQAEACEQLWATIFIL